MTHEADKLMPITIKKGADEGTVSDPRQVALLLGLLTWTGSLYWTWAGDMSDGNECEILKVALLRIHYQIRILGGGGR